MAERLVDLDAPDREEDLGCESDADWAYARLAAAKALLRWGGLRVAGREGRRGWEGGERGLAGWPCGVVGGGMMSGVQGGVR